MTNSYVMTLDCAADMIPVFVEATMSAPGTPERALWAAVVLQAKEDLEQEPLNSLDFNHAEAFFVGGGDWREARATIAAHLGVDTDCLEMVGKRALLARLGPDYVARLQRQAKRPLAPPPPPRIEDIRPIAPVFVSAPRRTHAFVIRRRRKEAESEALGGLS